MIITARKKPVEIQAMRWDDTASAAAAIAKWTGNRFGVLDVQDRENCDDPDATAQVFDVLHSTWVLVQPGDWIIRGVKGEFYPCRDEVFAETYDQGAAAVDAGGPATPIDNEREARAIALRFALDLGKEHRIFTKSEVTSGDDLTAQVLKDAQAFDAFIRGRADG